MFVTATYTTLYISVLMFMTYLKTKFHTPSSNHSLVVTIRATSEKNFHMTTTLLLLCSKIYHFTNICIIFPTCITMYHLGT